MDLTKKLTERWRRFYNDACHNLLGPQFLASYGEGSRHLDADARAGFSGSRRARPGLYFVPVMESGTAPSIERKTPPQPWSYSAHEPRSGWLWADRRHPGVERPECLLTSRLIIRSWGKFGVNALEMGGINRHAGGRALGRSFGVSRTQIHVESSTYKSSLD